MGVSKLKDSCVFLDEELLRFMDLLELLEEKRAAFNSLIEQVVHKTTYFLNFLYHLNAYAHHMNCSSH